MKKKNTKIWIMLLVAPIALLIFTALLQVFVRYDVGGGDSNAMVTIVNLIALLVGIFAVLGLLGAPIWIIMLVLAIQHNNKIVDTPLNSNLAPTHSESATETPNET